MGDAPALVVNGWTILVHPLFLAQVETTVFDVRRARRKDPEGFRKKNCTRRLRAILKLAFEDIPQDPTNANHRQGNTPGGDYTNWLRATFFQQYRLFFRYDLKSKFIIYAWVNDESTKRACQSSRDAYAVFRSMLLSGNPPDDWAALKTACLVETTRRNAADGSTDLGLLAVGMDEVE